jgi:hypothetical protein
MIPISIVIPVGAIPVAVVVPCRGIHGSGAKGVGGTGAE